MKPPAMERALKRAAAVRWAAEYEGLRLHIKALTTKNREMEEDYREQEAKRHIEDMRFKVNAWLVFNGFDPLKD